MESGNSFTDSGKGEIIVNLVRIRNHRREYCGYNLKIENKSIVNLIFEEWDSLKNNKLSDNLKRKELVSKIFLLMLALAKADLSYNNTAEHKEDYQIQIIDMIKEHIKSNSGKNLTTNKLARLAGYSKFHFLRLFKQHTGESIHEYINVVRISKVKSMLKDGYSKKEIANELGFLHASSFSQWFRKKIVE